MSYPLCINTVDDLISPTERDNCISYDDGLLNYIGLDFPITQYNPLNYTHGQKVEMDGKLLKTIFCTGTDRTSIHVHIQRIPVRFYNYRDGPAILDYRRHGDVYLLVKEQWIVDNKIQKIIHYVNGEISTIEEYDQDGKCTITTV